MTSNPEYFKMLMGMILIYLYNKKYSTEIRTVNKKFEMHLADVVELFRRVILKIYVIKKYKWFNSKA